MCTADFSIDRPFFQRDQTTPVSSSPSRSISPFTPNDRSRSPFGRSLRSTTSPIPRDSPSPEPLSSNLDCAFPPFPTTKPSKSQPQPARYGGYGGMGGDMHTEPDLIYPSSSPRYATSGGLLQQMNATAHGPFDIDGERRLGKNAKDRGCERQATTDSAKDMVEAARSGASIQRPATAGAGHSRTSSNSFNDSNSGLGSKQPRKNGYGGFGKPPPAAGEDDEREMLRPEQRSQTFPLRSSSQKPALGGPSKPEARLRRPSNGSGYHTGSERLISGSPPRQRKPSVSGPDLTKPLPPWGASLVRSRTDVRAGNAPPVPAKINLAAEFGIGNPYHTPSESQSSDTSGYSQGSKASSQSSPPSATARPQRRQPSDTSNMEFLTSNVQASMLDMQPWERPPVEPALKKGQFARAMLPPKDLDPSFLSRECPMDPAIQGGRISPVPAYNHARTGEPANPAKKKPVRRATIAKGNCKGCGQNIKGKSISSADGRLTGRYHKQCFVCQICSKPFQTATFYVHDDRPFCEWHYHKVNGSVCNTCDKGIEGQYLESESKQKFHPSCLTCSDCKRVLRYDYFEMDNRVYCEQDAFRRAQQQTRYLAPGDIGARNRMERRTTRLMMM